MEAGGHPADGPVRDDAVLHDPARLSALVATGLMDTPDEEAFDKWCRLAVSRTGADAAVLSLVDDERAYFKAFHRADGQREAGREVPIEASLCRELIVRGTALTVDDAAHDPRSRTYAAVREKPVGAYLGVPITSADGHVLGAFCLLHTTRRHWTDADVEAVSSCGAGSELEVRLRASSRTTERLEGLIATQQRAHRLMLDGAQLGAVLDELVLGTESELDGVSGSILVLDEAGEHLHHAAAPSLPGPWCLLVDGIRIGPDVGACGTAAALGEDVLTTDIATDPRWEGFRAALDHGLAACWSTPIRGSAGTTLGTFALYAGRPRTPTPDELRVLHHAADLAAIALERDEAERRMLSLTTRDPLTELPNRQWLTDALQGRLEANDRRGKPTAVLFCDLDGFKLINDSLGHEVGDAVLREVAGRIAGELRDGDLVARMGGDEFVVVPRGVVDEREAEAVADRVVQAVSRPILDAQGVAHVVTASVGVALVRDVEAREAIRRADTAMYVAKRSHSAVSAYRSDLLADRQEELVLLDALRVAVDHGHFHLVHQPIVDAATGEVAAVEALLRWEHPGLGAVTPARFIPIAERHALMGPIGAWVVREALAALPRLRAACGRDIGMSINLSPSELEDRSLPRRIGLALARAQLTPADLTIELTETALLAERADARAVLRDLADVGCRLALDDFGTGYSSLRHLRDLPISVVKVDRSFVGRLDEGGEDAAIVAGVIGLAHGLGLATTAEGVETPEQAQRLRALGCDALQGYLFTPPVREGVLAGLLGSRLAAVS